MRDFDITANYHRGDPQSSAAHARTSATRATHCQLIADYIEGRPRGATFAEAGADLGLVRQTVTSRFSDLQWKHRRAFAVSYLHRFGLFTDIEEERPVPGSRTPAQVLIGRRRVLETYGPDRLRLILIGAGRQSGARGSKAPIEQMNDNLWLVYRFVDQCNAGTTCDAAGQTLRLGQGNCSNLFRDLRKIKAFVPVKILHQYGVLLTVRATRQTRQRQAVNAQAQQALAPAGSGFDTARGL